MSSGDAIASVVVCVATLAVLVIMVFRFRRKMKSQQAEVAKQREETQSLHSIMLEVIDGLPLSYSDKEELRWDIDVPLNPACMRAMIRLLPSSYKYDIIGACWTVELSTHPDVTLTPDDLTPAHVELHDFLYETYRNSVEVKKFMRKLDPKAMANGRLHDERICVLMQNLGEYPQLLPIVRVRGIHDVQEALETARAMKSSAAPSLSEGML